MAGSLEHRFATLVAPHFDALYRVALRLTRKRQDAEDLVQDVCVRACARIRELERAAQPRAWLLQVQYRLFVDRARRRRRSPFVDAPGDTEPEAGAPSTEDTVDAELGNARLAAAWARLAEDQRALLGMHAEGYTLAELEAITGIARNALSARLHRARARFAQLLRRETDCAAAPLERTS